MFPIWVSKGGGASVLIAIVPGHYIPLLTIESNVWGSDCTSQFPLLISVPFGSNAGNNHLRNDTCKAHVMPSNCNRYDFYFP